MKITINEVAKKAGVSITTVSRVINGQYQFMSTETREKVERVIKEFGYIPNSLAQGLKSQRTNLIGVLISDIAHPYWATVLDGIELTCRESGFSVLICNAQDDSDLESHYMMILQTKQVDGIIVNPTGSNPEKFEQLVKSDYPLITLDRKLETLGIPSVGVNNVMGAKLAIEYLLELGHKRIGIVQYELNGLSNRAERLKGYQDALHEAGIPIDNQLMVFVDSRINNGRELIRNLFQQNNPPTAIFSTNLLLNIEVLAVLKELNLSVPNDISMLGYDDADWMQFLPTPLTTVFQPSFDLGVAAAQKLLDRIEGESVDSMTIQLTPELIIRESCRRITG